MKVAVSRLEGFSDALIAIIMTLMVLEIHVPQYMTGAGLLEFLKSILIYGASFIVVGSQWTRHHRMLDQIGFVSENFVWMNLMELFFLSLIPLFMKWLLCFPSGVIPAMAYAAVYLLGDFGMRILFMILMNDNKEMELIKTIETRREKLSLLHGGLMVLCLGSIFALSALLPEISIVCFIILPAALSLRNLFVTDDRKVKRWPNQRNNVRRLGYHQ